MLLEHAALLGDGQADGRGKRRVLVGRVADGHARVARAKEVDLVEFKLVQRRRVFGDAVHEREVLLPVPQEGHDVVEFARGDTGRGDHHRQIRQHRALQQRPIGTGAARDLEDVEAAFDDEFDGGLVERRAHGEHALRFDLVDEALIALPRQLRLGEPLDIFDVGAAGEIRMDQAVQVPVLQLDREPIRIGAADAAELTSDVKAMLHVAHVVVGHLQHEEGGLEEIIHDSVLLDREHRAR